MECLCDECRDHFDVLQKALAKVGAVVHHDKRLVRGLDYYTKTAFEIQSGDLGSQNAVCGGGRYDNLSESIGGPHVPGVGFASGVERIVMTMEAQGCTFGREPASQVYVVSADPSLRYEAMEILHKLRGRRISADMDYTGKSLKSQMKSAGNVAAYACIVGAEEIEKGVVTLKNLGDGTQEQLSFDALVNKLGK